MSEIGTVSEPFFVQDEQTEHLPVPSCHQPSEFYRGRGKYNRKPSSVRNENASYNLNAGESSENGKFSKDSSEKYTKRKEMENLRFRRYGKANGKYQRPPTTFERYKNENFAATSAEERTVFNACDQFSQQEIGLRNVVDDFSEHPGAVGSSNSGISNGAINLCNDSQDSRGQVVGGRYMRKNLNQPRKTASNDIYFSPNKTVNNLQLVKNHDGQFHRKNNTMYNFGSREDSSYEALDCRSREKYYQAGSCSNFNYFDEGNYGLPSVHKNVTNHYHKEHSINGVNLFPSQGTKPRIRLNDKLYRNYKFDSRSSGQDNKPSSLESKSVLQYKVAYKDNDAAQLERLTYQLHEGDYECMVCCDTIKVKDHIWHCLSCYHVFHLWCIRKWARSPAAAVEESGWRCPACQNITKKIPLQYFCFCGKCKEPEVNHHLTPHSCGEVCGNLRSSSDCPHRCNILCHPGPCPPCSASVTKECGCGKLKKTLLCKQAGSLTCGSVCGKMLSCKVHECKELCHLDDCQPCCAVLTQECFCMKDKREVPCSLAAINGDNFSCGEVCGRLLMCGHHYCDLLCHEGLCNECSFSPSILKCCPCGKTSLDSLYEKSESLGRKTCADPVPVCNLKCNKLLKCGPKDNPHKCDFLCHTGDCFPCPLSTISKCRCGAITKEIPCSEFVLSPVLLCERRCNRRKECGRHKCLNLCCVNTEHKCELTCNKKLTCGNHQCQESCHNGNCPLCPNVSFEELTCRCGSSVLFPPIRCGTKPPECVELCNRSHPCDHPVQHSCHSDENCPPCTVLTTIWCYGKHVQRKSVQCFLDGISCGFPCDKPLPCGLHKCLETCHQGSCLKNNSQCMQPCSTPRPDCGHPCGSPCHVGPCPSVPCKAKVNMACPCGNRVELVVCSDNSKAYHLMSVSMLATRMQDIKLGHSVNIGDILGKKNKLNKLQCNEECAILERNKRLALALQIQNPELSAKPGPPTYSEFLKDEVRKNQTFVTCIYDKLTELVKLAKQSKQKSRSHAFPPMNRDQRRVIHELAEFFGCETQSYDEEPKKSVTVTATRDKCWLPFASVVSVVQREMGLRKGPTPMIYTQVKSRGPNNQSPVSEQKERAIDYFNFTGS